MAATLFILRTSEFGSYFGHKWLSVLNYISPQKRAIYFEQNEQQVIAGSETN